MIQITQEQYSRLIDILPAKVRSAIYDRPNPNDYPRALRSHYYRAYRHKNLPDPDDLTAIIDILVQHPLFFGGRHQNATITKNNCQK